MYKLFTFVRIGVLRKLLKLELKSQIFKPPKRISLEKFQNMKYCRNVYILKIMDKL